MSTNKKSQTTACQERYAEYLQKLSLARAANCLNDPIVQVGLENCLSPLRHGQIAARASRRLENYLVRRAAIAMLKGNPPPELPDYPPDTSIEVAEVCGTGGKLKRLHSTMTGHCFLGGSTGSGKTTAQVTFMDALSRVDAVRMVIFARKEAGRLLLRYPTAILLRPHELPVNFLDPIGDPRLFFAELIPILARGIGVRSDYVPKFLEIVIRAHAAEAAKGRKLSLKKLEKVFRALGERGDRRWETISAALSTFNLFLRETARIEEAPVWEDDFKIIILDREAAPPAYRSCLDGLMQMRFQLQAAQQGFTNSLRRVVFYDEAGLEFGRENDAQHPGIVSNIRRSVSQLRAYGVAMMFSGQSYASISDDIKDNTNEIYAFRTVSIDDIRELSVRMNLSEDQQRRLPMLPPGRAFVAASDLPGPVEVQFKDIDLGDYPPEERIAARMAPILQRLRPQARFTAEEVIVPLDLDEVLGEEASPEASPTPTADAGAVANGLLADHWALLRDVANFQDCGVAARFGRLRFGGSKGSRIKEELIQLGLLEVIEVRKSPVGAATRILRLTNLARSLPGI